MKHNDISIVAMENGLITEDTVRFIRFAYPLVRMRANILSYSEDQKFCLIKKYIHRLVTGDRPEDKEPIPYVCNRLQAFQLLGLDSELYDVSNYCYDSLILEGKIHDTAKGALAGAAPKGDPALLRIRSSRQIETLLVADPFSLDIYGHKVTELPVKTEDDLQGAFGDDICLPVTALPGYLDRPEELEALVNQKNFSFENCTEEFMTARLQEQDMPHGAQGIELVYEGEGEPLELCWMPYYLALRRTEQGDKYVLYSNKSTRPIDLFPVNESSHRSLHSFLEQLFSSRYYKGVTYSLTECVRIPLSLDRESLADNCKLNEHGNYVTKLTDEQLALVCMSDAEETVEVMKLITSGVGVITTREAGKLVYFDLTEEQREFCSSVLQTPERRYEKAFPVLKSAADNGNAEALYHVASCTFMGRGTEKDLCAALKMFEKAAEMGHGWALFYKGVCYNMGYGTEVDLDKAVACFESVDVRSPAYPIALHNIGTCYIKSKEYNKAAEALKKAESSRFVSAFTSFSLGFLYKEGRGVEKDPFRAFELYEQAAGRGHIAAAYYLALCYINGEGVGEDIQKAKRILKKVISEPFEDRVYFLGAKPFISYANLKYTDEDMEKRKEYIELYKNKAKERLQEL